MLAGLPEAAFAVLIVEDSTAEVVFGEVGPIDVGEVKL